MDEVKPRVTLVIFVKWFCKWRKNKDRDEQRMLHQEKKIILYQVRFYLWIGFKNVLKPLKKVYPAAGLCTLKKYFLSKMRKCLCTKQDICEI